uniref:Uncharacterized protein n=2 Tax=Ralstonia pickettii TaxID=329 RepID=C6BL12_RALP1
MGAALSLPASTEQILNRLVDKCGAYSAALRLGDSAARDDHYSFYAGRLTC